MLDLIQALKEGPAFDHAVIATYCFDAAFFETRLLDHCRLIARCQNITVLTDCQDYQGLCHLDGLRDINRSYLVQDVPAQRRFHPKLIFLSSPRAARLIVGSANFTETGLTSNLEMACTFDFDVERGGHLAEIQQAFAFLQRLAADMPGATFAQNIGAIATDCEWLNETASRVGHFVHNLDHSLLDQIEQRIGHAPVEEYLALSPFFDTELDVVSHIVDRLSPKRVTLVTKNDDTTLSAQAVAEWRRAYRDVELSVKLLQPGDQNMRRRLHAKAHAFRQGDRVLLLFGSANCTSDALLSSKRRGNVETGVLVQGVPVSDLEALIGEAGELQTVADLGELRPRADTGSPLPMPAMPVQLSSVMREDRLHLRLSVNGLSSLSSDSSPHLQIDLSDSDGQAASTLPLMALTQRDGERLVRLSDDAAEGLDRCAACARIVVSDGRPLSSWRLIENLEEGGLPLRLQRAWQDSAKDASQFRQVLQLLCAGEDTKHLIQFLQVCNVQMDAPFRSRELQLREMLPPGQSRRLDRHECETVREAFSLFARRHLGKLEAAVMDADKRLAPGVARVALTLSYAVQSIWQWELEQLGRDQVAVDLDRWHDFREAAGQLVETYRRLVQRVCDYIGRIGSLEKALQTSSTFQDISIRQLSDHALEWITGADLDFGRLFTQAHTRNVFGSPISLPLGNQDEIAPQNWIAMRTEMTTGIARWA
jgi:hypothetical protein